MTNDDEAEAIRRAALSLDDKISMNIPIRPAARAATIPLKAHLQTDKPEYLDHYTLGELLK